jgi:hypothetical protein
MIELQISARMDRVAVEALQLEIRRLAKRHGIEVEAIRITREDSPPPDGPGAPAGPAASAEGA